MNPDLLSQLRDIHSAPQVSWWPPAPGWWVLAFLLLMLLVWIGRGLLRRLRVVQRRKQMMGWVDHLNSTIDPDKDPYSYLSTINRIFKVVALRAFPEQHCAVMAGSEWTDFLQQQFSDERHHETLAALESGPYNPAPTFDPAAISDLTRQWIKQHG